MSSSPDIDAEVKRTLDLRLVRGEITKPEYEAMLGTLRESVAPFPARGEPRPSPGAFVAAPTAPPPVPARMDSDAQSRAIGLSRSYIGAALLSWVLYYIGFYLVGFIVNLCYLSSAKRIKNETGINPSGRGFLQFVFFLHFWLPLVCLGLIAFFGARLGLSLPGLWQDAVHAIQRFFR